MKTRSRDQLPTDYIPAKTTRELANDNLLLTDALSTYLCKLSERIPETTYMSHKQKITTFSDWQHVETVSTQDLVEIMADFIQHLCIETPTPASSVTGFVYSLSNFGGYLLQDDPEIVAIRLLYALEEQSDIEYSELTKKYQKIWLRAEPRQVHPRHRSTGSSRTSVEVASAAERTPARR